MSALRAERKERLYRTYVTETLRTIVENTSKAIVPGIGLTGIGSVMAKSWSEIEESIDTNSKKEEPKEDNRPAAEIAADMWKRIRGGK